MSRQDEFGARATYSSSVGVGTTGLVVGGILVAVGLTLAVVQRHDTACLIAGLICAVAGGLVLLFRVRVAVVGDEVHIAAFAPGGRRRVPLAEVTSVVEVPLGAIAEIGVRRFGPDSWGYLTGSGHCARLTLRDGGNVTVAVRDVGGFAAAVEQGRPTA